MDSLGLASVRRAVSRITLALLGLRLVVPCTRPAARRRADLRVRVRRWVVADPVSQRALALARHAQAQAALLVWFRLRARRRVLKGRAVRRVAVAAIVATKRAKKAR